MEASIEVSLETSMGRMAIVVQCARAPASARAFLKLIDDGGFARHGTFYRACRAQENDKGKPAIDILQGGWRDVPQSLAVVEHETTEQTGLRHVDGAVSLVRGVLSDGKGSATGALFFICIGDQPALDAGGRRDPYEDGLGFAVIGRVTQGMEVVRSIHRMPTTELATNSYLRGQMLRDPVRIVRACRGPLAGRLRPR